GSCSEYVSWRGPDAVLADAFQDDHRDLALRASLVLGEPGHPCRLRVVETAALGAARDARLRLEALRPDLHGHARMLAQVVVLVGILRRAALRRDDHDVVAVASVIGRGRLRLPRSRALCP